MPTYVYETIPAAQDKVAVRFEVQQSMSDEPLKEHPETGEPVRRVISGGFGHISKSEPIFPEGRCGDQCKCFN